MRRRWQASAELLSSPVFVLSILVLYVNDHVAKALWPGWWTGKVSDVAGVAMVAIVLIAVTGSSRVGCWSTLVLFAALKLVPAVAVVAAPVLGGVTRTDPTDLIALGVLAPIHVWARNRDHCCPRTAWLVLLQLMAVTASVVTTTATSCMEDTVTAVEARGRTFFVAVERSPYTWYASVDGGRSWMKQTSGRVIGQSESACLDDGTCFLLHGSSVIETRPDGTTRTAFQYTPAEIAAQERNALACRYPHDGFQAIAAAELPDGPYVVVAMGSQGVLTRTPDGIWHPRRVGDAEPISTDTYRLPGAWRTTLLVPPLIVVAAIVLARLNQRLGGRRGPVIKVGVLVAAAMLLPHTVVPIYSVNGAGADRYFRIWGIAVSIAGLVALLGLTVYVRRPRRPLPPPEPGQRIG